MADPLMLQPDRGALLPAGGQSSMQPFAHASRRPVFEPRRLPAWDVAHAAWQLVPLADDGHCFRHG